MRISDSSPTVTSDVVEEAIATLCRAVQGAMEDDEVTARLAAAQTTVRIVLREDPGRSVTLRLDGRTPMLSLDDDRGPVECEVEIEAQALLGTFAKELRLPMMFVRGRASYRGPVRKFLRVVPILIAEITPPVAGEQR